MHCLARQTFGSSTFVLRPCPKRRLSADGRSVELLAVKDLAAGQEATISYTGMAAGSISLPVRSSSSLSVQGGMNCDVCAGTPRRPRCVDALCHPPSPLPHFHPPQALKG